MHQYQGIDLAFVNHANGCHRFAKSGGRLQHTDVMFTEICDGSLLIFAQLPQKLYAF